APWYFRPVLACASWIGTQEAAGRDAFVAIGATSNRVEVVGDLKTDAPVSRRVLPASISSQLMASRVLVAGSTHHPEESWLLDETVRLRREWDLRLVLAPRDIRRTTAIAGAAAARQLRCTTWSAVAALGAGCNSPLSWDVLVVDVFGWLPAL